ALRNTERPGYVTSHYFPPRFAHVSRQWQVCRGAHRNHRGQCGGTAQQLLIEITDFVRSRIGVQRKGNGHGKGAVRLEARIGFQQSREASKQKSRTGEKDYGERGLGDYKCTAHAPARVAVCRSAKRLFKPFVRVRTRSLQGRPQPEENS